MVRVASRHAHAPWRPRTGEFGYTSKFPRGLRRFALLAIAYSIVSITTGIFLNYSYGITQLGPAAVWLWPVAAVGQLLVVLVLAELAGYIPLAGVDYQWAARLVNTPFGYVGALVRVQLAARVNNVAVFAEIIGTVVLSVVVFVAWVRGGDAATVPHGSGSCPPRPPAHR